MTVIKGAQADEELKVNKASHATDMVPLTEQLQGHLGKHLRAAYSELVKEPVPGKFFDLLSKLQQKESEGK